MKLRQAAVTFLFLVAALAGAPAAAQEYTLPVPVVGVVSGSPESVVFSGLAQVKSRLVPDPDFGNHSLLLRFDMSGVSGAGSLSLAKYVVLSGDLVQRRLADSHRIDVIFPFMKASSDDLSSAQSGVAFFALTVDVITGAVIQATAAVETPDF